MKEETIFLSPDSYEKFQQAAQNAGLCRSRMIGRLLDQLAANLTTEEIFNASESFRMMVRTKKVTQKDAFLQMLQDKAEISSKLAKALGIKNPSYVVHVLRQEGHMINDRWAYQYNIRTKKTNYKIYSLQCA